MIGDPVNCSHRMTPAVAVEPNEVIVVLPVIVTKFVVWAPRSTVVAAATLAAAEKGGAPAAGAPGSPYLIERIILHFPEVAARAARELAPNLLVNYLTELAGEWNSFYAKERIIGGENEAHKLMLVRAFVNTMTNGLALLGIPAPDKM